MNYEINNWHSLKFDIKVNCIKKVAGVLLVAYSIF